MPRTRQGGDTVKYCYYPWGNGSHFCGREAGHLGVHACQHFDVEGWVELWQLMGEDESDA